MFSVSSPETLRVKASTPSWRRIRAGWAARSRESVTRSDRRTISPDRPTFSPASASSVPEPAGRMSRVCPDMPDATMASAAAIASETAAGGMPWLTARAMSGVAWIASCGRPAMSTPATPSTAINSRRRKRARSCRVASLYPGAVTA